MEISINSCFKLITRYSSIKCLNISNTFSKLAKPFNNKISSLFLLQKYLISQNFIFFNRLIENCKKLDEKNKLNLTLEMNGNNGSLNESIVSITTFKRKKKKMKRHKTSKRIKEKRKQGQKGLS